MSPEKSLTPQIRFKGFTEAWEQRKFSDVVKTRRGLTYKPTDISNNGVRVLRSSNISDDIFVQRDDDVFVKREAVNIECVNENDILITSANGSSRLVGKHAIVSSIKTNQAVHGGFMLLASTKEPYFINASMSSAWYKKFIELFVAGGNGSIGNLSKNDLDNYEIFIPVTNEQRKLGFLFRGIDYLITLHQRKLDALKKIKSALLEKMFPKDGSNVPEIRFTGFTEAWEQRKFSDTFDFLSNNTLSRSQLSDTRGSTLNIHYGDVLIKFGELIDVSKELIPRIANDSIADILSCQKLKNGDVVIADTAEDITVGKCSELRKCENKDIVSGLHTIACRPQLKFANGYLGYYMNSNSFHNQLLPLMQGTKVISISKSAIKNTEINYPNLVEQRLIGKILIASDILITLHQRKLDALKKIKSALLEKMFV